MYVDPQVRNAILRSQTAAATPASAPSASVEVVKARIPPFTGEGGESFRRWFAEMEDALSAQKIVVPRSQAYFATTCLGGRARAWAMSRRSTDGSAFLPYQVLKAELKLNFEAPEMELSCRKEFMELRQGKLSLHAYARKKQYVLSNIVYEPVPPAMLDTAFMKGLNDGPIKQCLYRAPPKTLRDAIDQSIREEFSMRQSAAHAGVSRKAQAPFDFNMPPMQHVNTNNNFQSRRSSHFVPDTNTRARARAEEVRNLWTYRLQLPRLRGNRRTRSSFAAIDARRWTITPMNVWRRVRRHAVSGLDSPLASDINRGNPLCMQKTSTTSRGGAPYWTGYLTCRHRACEDNSPRRDYVLSTCAG